MAEIGSFRTGLGGFNKKDVLRYIDENNAAHAEEVAALEADIARFRQQAEDAEKRARDGLDAIEQAERKATELLEENVRLQQAAEETGRLNQELRQRLAAMEDQQAEVDRLREQAARAADDARTAAEREQAALARLEACERQSGQARTQEEERAAQAAAQREQLRRQLEEYRRAAAAGAAERETLLAEKARLAADLQEARRQWDEKKKRCEELETANRRYGTLVGDVGGFIMEVRSMGQKFLETAFRRSEGCLDDLDGAVTGLEHQLKETRADVEQARQELNEQSTAAGLRLEELVQALEESGELLDSPGEKASPGEEPSAGDAFFR